MAVSDPDEDDFDDAMPLIAQLVQSNYNQYAATSQSLIDNYKEQARKAEAVIEAIRDRINTLLEGDYMPSPRKLKEALYPPQAVISYYLEEDTP